MPSYTDRAEDEVGPATELLNCRDTFPLSLSEDVGEAMERTTSSNPTDVGKFPVLTFDIHTSTRPGRRTDAKMRLLHQREGAGLETINPAHSEIGLQQTKASAAITGSKSQAPSAPIKRQRKRKSVNAIDDLFQGLK